MKYIFEYDEISCCYDCPLFYDYLYCELEVMRTMHTEETCHRDFTDRDDNKRPEWCQLIEKEA